MYENPAFIPMRPGIKTMNTFGESLGLIGARWTGSEGVEELEVEIRKRTTAAERIASVNDISPIVAFLCDPSAQWITGNVTCANGGLILL